MSIGHKCPAPECAKQVSTTQFACRDDWFRLPANLRIDINATYRERQRAKSATPLERGPIIADHLAALRAGVEWLRANPR